MKVSDAYSYERFDVLQSIRDNDPTVSHILVRLFNLSPWDDDNSQPIYSNDDVEMLGRSLALNQHVKMIGFHTDAIKTDVAKGAIVRRQMEELEILFKIMSQYNTSMR